MRSLKVLSILVLGSIALVGCGKSDKKNSAGAAGVSGSGTVSAQRVDGAPASCENSITVDNEGGDLTQLSGKFKLDSLQLYVVASPTNDSFAASAKAEKDFEVSVDCEGLRDVAEDNNDRTWTDSEGTHRETNTHTTSMEGTFQAGQFVDLFKDSNSTAQRKISVKFKDGKLESAKTETVEVDIEKTKMGELPKGPFEVGEGLKLTVNARPLDANSFEIKIKIEAKEEGDDGVAMTQYGRAVYVRQP